MKTIVLWATASVFRGGACLRSFILFCLFEASLHLGAPVVLAGEQLDRLISIDIPGNTRLEDALIEWGTKAGLTVMINTTTVNGKLTKEVKGKLVARKALLLILSNSGLSYTEEGNRIRVVQNNGFVRSAARDGNTTWVSSGAATEVSSDELSSEPDSSSGPGQGQLQEVTVTAQRREESIQKVPISITALPQKALDDLHIQSLPDLATVVPGLVLSPPVATAQDNGDIAIRGIFSNGNAPTTQMYIDETPIAIRQLGASYSRSPWPEIFDLDRVEVLRGPQGTLFGASAMGGAIRFITPDPNMHDSSGFTKADVSYTDGGSPNYEVGGAYGGPIVNGGVAFRVSAWYQSLGGFIDREDPFTGQVLQKNANTSESYVIRPAFKIAPSDALSVTASLFLQHYHDQDPNSYWLTGLANTEGENHAWGGINQPMTDDLKVWSLSIKYDFASVSLVSDSSYLDRNSTTIEDNTRLYEGVFNDSADPFLPGLQSFVAYDKNTSFTHAWQQEFRLSSQDPSSRVNWVAGLFYRKAVQGLQQIQPPDLTPVFEADYGLTSQQALGLPNYIYNGQVLNFYDDFQSTDISEAVFGDVTVAILPRLKLDIGGRFEHQVVEHQDQLIAGPLNAVEYSNVTVPDQVGNPVTPKASLTYQYTDADMVYVSAAKGYRPGGGNVTNINGNPLCEPSLSALGLTAAPETFSSDSLWSYEFGAKDLVFNNHLSIAGSMYYIKWNDIQTVIGLPSCANGFTSNEGKAISKGFDLQLNAEVTRELKVGAVAGYTDAYYPNAAYGALVNGVPSLINGAGDKLRNVLPWTAAANVEYSHNVPYLWSDTRAYIRTDYRWLSGAVRLNPEVAGFDPAVQLYQNPSYGVLNIRVGLTHGGLDLSAYANNVTNADPRLGYSHDYPGETVPFYAVAIRPLTFGITSWYRF